MLLGVKRKIALTALAGVVTLGAQAQITFEEEQTFLRTADLNLAGKSISFIDFDNDGDLDIINFKDTIISARGYGKFNYLENDGNENFTQLSGNDDPFDGLLLNSSYLTPTIVDLDGDGDFDIVEGAYDGTFPYRENDGSNVFTEKTGSDNPLNGLDVGTYSTPTFVDLDDDGDLDLFSTNYDGGIEYFKNNGANSFTEQTGTDNPFDAVALGAYGSLAFVDVDVDGDLDLAAAVLDEVHYFQNDGANAFTELTNTANPFNNVDIGNGARITFIDLDSDQDKDLVYIRYNGYQTFYNDQSEFRRRLPINIPSFDADSLSTPAFYDYTGNGSFDMVTSNENGSFKSYRNDTRSYFQENTSNSYNSSSYNIFYSVKVTNNGAPTIVDYDKDGDVDMLVGQADGTFSYYEDLNYPKGAYRGLPTAFDYLDVGFNSKPTFIDLDGDTYVDLVSGEAGGTFKYYKYDSLGVFTEQTGANNPFDGLSVSGNSAPAFVDLDGDNDFDLVSGSTDGTFSYFENDGSNVFTELTGANNPFDGLDVGDESTPAFVNLPFSSDIDLVSGSKTGAFYLYKNTSSFPDTSTETPTSLLDLVGERENLTTVRLVKRGTPISFESTLHDVSVVNIQGQVIMRADLLKELKTTAFDNGLYFIRSSQGVQRFVVID